MPKTQLYIGERPLPEKMQPVKDWRGWCKPIGGLWTSTHIPRVGSAWTQWCDVEGYGLPEGDSWGGWLLLPREDARVYTVDNLGDLTNLQMDYPLPEGVERCGMLFLNLSFESMAQDYDAMRLTEEGQWATRFTTPSLYGWDCESTVWFRWAFKEVRGPVHVKTKKLDFYTECAKEV